jgi:hypothetical protein
MSSAVQLSWSLPSHMVLSSIRQQVQVKAGLSAGCMIDGSTGVLPAALAAAAGTNSTIVARSVRRSRRMNLPRVGHC